MRVGFSTQELLNERIEVYSRTTEFRLRRAWEDKYNMPSLGNPLFEDVPVEAHLIHLLAIGRADEEKAPAETPDEHLSGMMESLESGEDPFVDIRDKLRRLSDNLEEFEDIDFERS